MFNVIEHFEYIDIVNFLILSLRSRSSGSPAKTHVVERTKPMIKTRKSEQLLEDYKKKRKHATDSETNVAGSKI